jgi:hypothetical protein
MVIISRYASCHGPLAPNSERRIVATKFAVISPKMPLPIGRFWREADIPSFAQLRKVPPRDIHAVPVKSIAARARSFTSRQLRCILP